MKHKLVDQREEEDLSGAWSVCDCPVVTESLMSVSSEFFIFHSFCYENFKMNHKKNCSIFMLFSQHRKIDFLGH